MPAASSDDARGASPAASVLAPSEGETEDPHISAYVAHLAHVGDEMAPGLGALFADTFPEVPALADIHEDFTFSKNDSLLLFAGLDGNALTLAQAQAEGGTAALLSHARCERLRGMMFLAFNYADFGRSDTHANMLVGDVQFFGNGDLHFAHRKVKGLSGRVEASDYLWPADSCPDLLRALSFWLTLRSRMRLHPDGCEHMWRLPWEKSGFTTSRLRTIFADTLSSLNRRPPPGRKWTLHCIRAGPASECNALGIPISTIRRQGGWSAKSRVPSDRYIDSQCPPSAAGRRFFDWLTPDGHLRRLGAS